MERSTGPLDQKDLMRKLRQKNRREAAPGVIATASAIALATGLAALTIYGRVTGFNTSPRGPKPEIVLKNTDANRNLTCLREAFNDTVNGTLWRNRWVDENCPPELVSGIENSPNPLGDIVATRDQLLTAAGVQAGTVRWTQSQGGSSVAPDMAIETDPDKVRQAMLDGKIEVANKVAQNIE